MAIHKEKKREILAKLALALNEASALVFVSFSKLSVADTSKLRKELAQAGVRYFVAKKTLLRRALEQKEYSGETPDLPGEVAIAWTTSDITAPARGIYEQGKKSKGVLALLGGVLEGAFADRADVTALAVIPPIPVLRGMFVNVINSPIQGLVIALDQLSKK